MYLKDQGHIDFIETEILLDDMSFFNRNLSNTKNYPEKTYFLIPDCY